MSFQDLLKNYEIKVPKPGDLIKGKVITASSAEVRLDIEGMTIGIIRGQELYREAAEYANIQPGEVVEATVLELENEMGVMELSFRYAGHKKAWNKLKTLMEESEIVPVKIIDANKGGLMVKLDHIVGFLPVSQLTPEHYPRVQGGDKNKILERLKSYIDSAFEIKIIDVDAEEEKLIVSEKVAWEEKQKDVIANYKVGTVVEGVVTAITDFGAFVSFNDNLEGLVHISEIAWQRIDDPRKFLEPGEEIKAQIINIDGSKIFLSMKSLIADPWKNVFAKYNEGDIVEGKVLKVNPFGLFVELDPDIHGLAHISELSTKPVVDPYEIAKPGETRKFRILSIEPNKHRLGLSIKAVKHYKKEDEDKKEEKKTDKKEEKKEDKKEKEAPKKEEKVKEDKKEKKEEPKKEKKAEKTEVKEK